jgi:hypothetical protein
MEMNATLTRSDTSVLIKMETAINAHDLDAFVNCFANDFVSEQPVHPKQNFTSGSFGTLIAIEKS